MKKISTLLLVLCLTAFYSCKKDKKEDVIEDTTTEVNKEENTSTSQPAVYSDDVKKVRITLDSKNGSTANGKVVLKQEKNVLSMVVLMEGLSEGDHAIHIHDKADCGEGTGSSQGFIGNLTTDNTGKGTLNFSTQEWCIGCGDSNKDILGKALVVYQGTNNDSSKSACGIISE